MRKSAIRLLSYASVLVYTTGRIATQPNAAKRLASQVLQLSHEYCTKTDINGVTTLYSYGGGGSPAF